MEYKVLPFNASLKRNGSADEAARQLQQLIDQQRSQGYDYVRLEDIITSVEGTNGCLGFGAKPGYVVTVAVAIFKK